MQKFYTITHGVGSEDLSEQWLISCTGDNQIVAYMRSDDGEGHDREFSIKSATKGSLEDLFRALEEHKNLQQDDEDHSEWSYSIWEVDINDVKRLV